MPEQKISDSQRKSRLQRRTIYFVFIVLSGLLWRQSACADRVILAPDGTSIPAKGVKTETAISPYRNNQNLTWAQFATTEGMEFEVQRFDLASDPQARTSLNFQYPFLIDLGAVPALSFGVRDIFSTGVERTSVYVSSAKSLPLSDRQQKLFREIKLSGGAGTGRLGGLFFGVQARFAGNLSLTAEIYRHRPNFSVGLPLARNLQAKAYSLDGIIHYGFTFAWTH